MNEFDAIYSRLSGDMRGIAHKLDTGMGFADQSDLFQEELAYLWEGFKKGELSDKTDSYILQGCYFHLKNYLRPKDKRTRFESLENAAPVLGRKSISFYNGENDYEISSKSILDRLSGREKEVVSLVSSGFTTREAGEKLKVSHVTVVKIIKKIRKKYKN